MNEAPEKSRKFEGEFDDWQERLLKSLRECGAQPAPGFILLRYFFAGLFFALVIALSRIVSYFADEAIENRAPPVIVGALLLVYSIFAIAVLSRIRNALLRNAWRANARNAERELSRRTARRPVFYLRSFAMDKVLSRRSWLERYLGIVPLANTEQRVTSKLRRIGPVIAIGRPGEKLPMLGAARFYVPDHLWQQKVSDVVRESQLVVWMSGLSSGLGWELQHLKETIDPRKFVLWAHPHLLGLSEVKREQEWGAFLKKFGEHFPHPLPSKLGDARFFLFDAQWTPIPSPPRIGAIWATPDISALKRMIQLRQEGADGKVAAELSELSQQRDCRSFGDVIGAKRIERDWPRLLAFILALSIGYYFEPFLSQRFSRLVLDRSLSIGGFIAECFQALISVAILAAAYRLLQRSVLSIPVAAFARAVGQWTWGDGFFVSNIVRAVLRLGFLPITTRNSSRLLIGLLLGAGLGKFAESWLFTTMDKAEEQFKYDDSTSLVDYLEFCASAALESLPVVARPAFISAILFTISFCVFLKLLPLVWRKND